MIPVFDESFYESYEAACSYTLLENGSIAIDRAEDEPKKAFLKKCKEFLLGTKVDAHTQKIANTLKALIEDVQHDTYPQLQNEIHDHGAPKFKKLRVNFHTLCKSLEFRGPSLFMWCVIAVYSLARKLFWYTPVEIHYTDKFFKSDEAEKTFFKKIAQRSLQLNEYEKTHCQYTVELIKGSTGKLTKENFNKLECGLLCAIRLKMDSKKRFFIEYDKEKKEFFGRVVSSAFLQIPKKRPEPFERELASATIQEEDHSLIVKHSLEIYPNDLKNRFFPAQNAPDSSLKKLPLCLIVSQFFQTRIWGILHRKIPDSSGRLGIQFKPTQFCFQSKFDRCQLKPGNTYSIQLMGTALQFKINML